MPEAPIRQRPRKVWPNIPSDWRRGKYVSLTSIPSARTSDNSRRITNRYSDSLGWSHKNTKLWRSFIKLRRSFNKHWRGFNKRRRSLNNTWHLPTFYHGTFYHLAGMKVTFTHSTPVCWGCYGILIWRFASTCLVRFSRAYGSAFIPRLGMFCSQGGNILFPRWEQISPLMRTK